jgi:hypothetical protein
MFFFIIFLVVFMLKAIPMSKLVTGNLSSPFRKLQIYIKEKLEDNKLVIKSRKSKKEEAKQWPKERGQSMNYKILNR